MNWISTIVRPRDLRRLALVAGVTAFLVPIFPAFAQQPLQQLHDHVRSAVASGEAKLVGRVPSTQRIHLSFVLPLRNEGTLNNLLSELYDPSSPNYHQFLSVSQFTELFSPTSEDFQTVVDFAKTNGLTVTDEPQNRLVVSVDATAAQIEKTLNVKMNLYQHPTENRVFYSPDREPSLALNLPLKHIAGLDTFTLPRAAAATASAEQATPAGAYQASGPSGTYLGSDLRAAYYGGTALTGAGQVVGLFEYGGYNPSDVTNSFTTAGVTNNVPIDNVSVDGEGTGSSSCNGGTVSDLEQVLDIVGAIGMAPGMSQLRVYIAPCTGGTDVDTFNMIATDDIAKQISISWVWGDNATADDPIFKQMAAQGQSIFASSGDWGAYPNGFAAFPAEDPWVTAVGGTNLPAYNVPWPEVAWGTGACTAGAFCASSGGPSPDGISMLDWATASGLPNYQASVVNSSNGASTTLRNVPDVAAMSVPGVYFCPNGSCAVGFGTSLATPLWAGFTALMNEQALSAGKPPLGFLNPAIYAIGESSNYDSDFHDMTSGSNGAYNAVTGYDLVTGWGSPNGQNLIDALTGQTTTTPPSSSCHVVYTVNSQWPGAFDASLTIQNNSTTALSNWTLTWTFANGQKVTQSWGGNVTQSGATVTVHNTSNGGPIPANGSYSSFGFNGSWNNATNATPTTFTLNGTVCD